LGEYRKEIPNRGPNLPDSTEMTEIQEIIICLTGMIELSLVSTNGYRQVCSEDGFHFEWGALYRYSSPFPKFLWVNLKTDVQ
jgi:hypothetical protein